MIAIPTALIMISDLSFHIIATINQPPNPTKCTNKFNGYIDFYFACNDFLMYEIAICINALCFDKKNNKFIFNKKKSTNLIKGYSKIRKFSINEKKSLNILCKGAALRYLLTRTYDYLNTPKNAIIKIKNPREYIQKLEVQNRLNNFKNYYN